MYTAGVIWLSFERGHICVFRLELIMQNLSNMCHCKLDAIAEQIPWPVYKFRLYSDRLYSSYLNYVAERGTKSFIGPLSLI